MPTSAPQKLRNVNVFAASLFLDSFAKRKKYKIMWKETKVVKNVGYDNFDARFGAYATDEADKKSILYIGDKGILLGRVTCVKSYGDKVIVQVNDGAGLNDAMLYTKDGEQLNVVNNTISLDDNTNKRYLNVYMRDGVNYNDYNNLVDIETDKVIFKEDYLGLRFVFNDMIFSNRDNIITRYDWDGSILWQHNYEPDFNVTIDLGFVLEGVCGGKLWVKSKYDRHEILLAIDVNTGELVKAFSDSEEDTNLPHCNYGSFGGVYLNCENDHVLIVTMDREFNNFMNFVDAKTLDVIEKTDYTINYDYDDEYAFRISEFQGDCITVKIMGLNADFANFTGFAVYNYKTKEVVFAHRLITSEHAADGLHISTLSPLHYSPNSGCFLVHDNSENLHIFEDVKE